jgi:hypothetical protein
MWESDMSRQSAMRPMMYNLPMDKPENERVITAGDLFGDEKILVLYGHCPNCEEIHTNLPGIRDYLQWLSDQSMINFN